LRVRHAQTSTLFEEIRIGMENTALRTLFKKLGKPPILEKFSKPITDITIIIHRSSGERTVKIKGLAPFHTVEDINRALWLEQSQQKEYYPKYGYLAYEDEGELIPVMYTMFQNNEGITERIKLPDPTIAFENRRPLSDFIYESGEKKPILYNPRNRVTIEEVFLQTMGTIPVFHYYSFSYLKRLAGFSGSIGQNDWNGLFFPFFPGLERTATGDFTDLDTKQAEKTAELISAKLKQVELLDILLDIVDLPELKTTGVKYLMLQWKNTENEKTFDGVDTLFFSSPVDEYKPYMRLLTPNTVGLTKLYQPDILQPPLVNDPALLKTWSSEPNPIGDQNLLMIKVKLRGEEFGLRSLFGTLNIADDTTANFIIQPPKDQRILDYSKDFSDMPEILEKISVGMPYNLQQAKIGKASINVEISFDNLPPKNIKNQVADRLFYLNTLFQPAMPPKDEQQKPFLSYRYKAVSNFKTQDRITSFLNYVISRRGIQEGRLAEYKTELAKEFDISVDEAANLIADHIDKQTEVGVSDSEGKEFIFLDNPGIDISLYSFSANSFTLQLYNIRAVSLEDILRVCSIFNLAFKGTRDQWESALIEAKITTKMTAKIPLASAVVEQEDLLEEQKVAQKTGQERKVRFPVSFGLEEMAEEEMPEAPKPVVQQIQQKEKTAAKKAEKPEEIQSEKIISAQWFIKQLQRLDPALFDYIPKPGKLHYSSKCAGWDERYPVIFTQAEYDNMRRLYAAQELEGKVAFIEYGKPNTAETIKAAQGKDEQFIVMRYGSNPNDLHYFLCSRIFCLRDKLPITEADYYGELDYNKEIKKPETCPFCGGEPISNKARPDINETVWIRRPKEGASDNKSHDYIGFLAKTDQPDGYELPCCFKKRKDISWDDARFERIRKASRQTEVLETSKAIDEAAQEMAEKSKKLDLALQGREQLIASFDVLRWKISKEYVVGPVSYPLDPGKLGMPSVALDEFLGQNSSEFVARLASKQELKPTTHGFFRIGVLNKLSYQNQSLFAALAPLLNKNTIVAVADHFKALITPRVFINLNFGNLLLEFYDPSNWAPDESGNTKAPSMTKLSNWSKMYLGTEDAQLNEFELLRFYNSYYRFKHYIGDPNQRKQLRHFAHALAEPNLIVPQGLTVMTIHYKGDPTQIGTDVEVLCPMLGFDAERYANNSVGFLTFSDQGIWEPLVYIDKLSQTATAKSDVYYTVTQNQIQEPSFPDVVRKRYTEEFVVKCQSAYRGAFTLQSYVDNRFLLPITKAITLLGRHPITRPVGIVRDIYNHIVAITVTNPNPGFFNEILVPVVDDGNSFHNNTALKIYVGISGIDLASANDVYFFYNAFLTPAFYPLSNVYKVNSFVKTNKIIGFRLGGVESKATILLPCGDLREGGAEIIFCKSEEGEQSSCVKLELRDDEMFEYMLNREIMMAKDEESFSDIEKSSFILKKKEADIIYEHLRLSFSNWIASMERPDERKFVDDLVTYKPWVSSAPLSNYEKIRRLQIRYGSVLQNWFAMDNEPIDTKNILIKNDCISINNDEEKCGASALCKFENGTCRIHTPKEIEVRSTPESPKTMKMREDAATYFIKRLFDEIVRLPALRYELMNKGVNKLQIPSKNIHIGSQWIIPDNVPAWYNLLREKPSSEIENPQYYEEFSRGDLEPDEIADLSKVLQIKRIPEKLAKLIPQDTLNELMIQVVGDKNLPRATPIRRYFGISSTRGEQKDAVLSPENLKTINQTYKVPVIQVIIGGEKPIIMGVADVVDLKTSNAVYVIIPDYEDGPGILTVKDTVGDTIPSVYITGPIFDSVAGKKTVEAEKSKIKRPVIPTVKKNNKLPQEVKPQEEIPPSILEKTATEKTATEKPVTIKRPIPKSIFLNKKNN
jgi:hypothetical protein